MNGWLCVKCLHEFPDDASVKKQPEYVGMILFMLAGLAALVFGILVIIFRRDYALKGILLAAGGIAGMGFGWQLKTGLKANPPRRFAGEAKKVE